MDAVARNLVAHKLICAARADCNPAETEMGGKTGRRFARGVRKAIDRWEKTLRWRSEESPEEISSVARDVEKLKEMKSKVIKKRVSRRGVISEAREQSLAMALQAIEIADEEKEEKDSN
ncbi:uncharacterized protein A4U43_C07F35620 [Asparagus officinalis]|uniref:Uncharacterized protein n=1 Tax=Asparagus officinalis TaxID=4686 RepID=A0A5P1EL32_ASPOF|nr:uncharacterized protein A4U43_C07F35620 [Asparagus officinalis]